MESENRKTRKRLIINMPDNWHKDIKTRAARKGISMTAWINRAIMKMIAEEKKYE